MTRGACSSLARLRLLASADAGAPLPPGTAGEVSRAASAIVAEARARNVWVHMGRVNSLRRLAYAASIGCDSVDGTQWVRFRDKYLRQGLHACAAGEQLRFPAGVS